MQCSDSEPRTRLKERWISTSFSFNGAESDCPKIAQDPELVCPARSSADSQPANRNRLDGIGPCNHAVGPFDRGSGETRDRNFRRRRQASRCVIVMGRKSCHHSISKLQVWPSSGRLALDPRIRLRCSRRAAMVSLPVSHSRHRARIADASNPTNTSRVRPHLPAMELPSVGRSGIRRVFCERRRRGKLRLR